MTTTVDDMIKHCTGLAKKAAEANAAMEAVHYSQAACNVANALCAMSVTTDLVKK